MYAALDTIFKIVEISKKTLSQVETVLLNVDKRDENVTNPPKNLEWNVDGSPGVSEVFITSHFPLPPDTHLRAHTHTFISLLAEL